MASYPPPYPPPPPGSYGFDPRQQRRLLRDQARAQRAMYKAQRDFYKQQQRGILLQSRGVRRGSILGPLIVVVLGVVLLLIRMGRLPFERFAGWYGRWWPLLFVAAGAVLVLEWAFDKATESSDRPYVRRGAGGGVFLLLLVLAVTGAIVHGVRHHETIMRDLSITPDNFAEFIGDKHEREQTIDQAFPAGTSLSIDNPHGDVTVLGKSGDNQIHVVADKEIYSESDSDADDKADQLSPSLRMTDGRLSVSLPWKAGATVDLTVTVPDFAQTTVSAGHGDVHVTALKSPVSVTANNGDVDVNNIEGAVTAHIDHRDSSFSANTISGDVSMKGNADDLNLSGITGTVTLEGDFYGDTHLEHITGATVFRTSRTNLSFAKLNGVIDISPEAELTGDQIAGPMVLTTRSRNITLQHVAGDLSVTNSNGSVDLTSASPLADVFVNNRSGAVTLTVPEDSGFRVDATTTEGDISNDFGLSTTGTDGHNTIHATVGSGRSKISLATTHGDLAIRKGEAGSGIGSTPAQPATPPPAAKGKKTKQVGASVTF